MRYSVDNSDDNVLKAVNINIYNAIYQRICSVYKITKTLYLFFVFEGSPALLCVD